VGGSFLVCLGEKRKADLPALSGALVVKGGVRSMEIGPIRKKFDFLATRQYLVKIDEAQQKKLSAPTNNQIYAVPANQISPSAGAN